MALAAGANFGSKPVNFVADRTQPGSLGEVGWDDEGVKARLRAIARGRLDADGRIVVVSQATRDQPKNLADARAKLAELVVRALVPPRPRKPTRPTAGSRERRLKQKQHRARRKADRRAED